MLFFVLNKHCSESFTYLQKPIICLPAFLFSYSLFTDYFSLTEVTSPALQCGTPPIKAPCNAKGMSSCEWISLNSVDKVFCGEHKSSKKQPT